jgi:hypothetical protein
VSVSFTTSTAWAKEEPARREVYAKVVRKVAEAGAGFCDAASITGAGPHLQGTFQPTSTPRAAADVERTLARLSMPIKPRLDDEREAKLAPTVTAALEGTAAKATVEALLPPPELLRKFRSAKPHGGRLAREEDVDDFKRERFGVAGVEVMPDEDIGVTRAAPRKRKTTEKVV